MFLQIVFIQFFITLYPKIRHDACKVFDTAEFLQRTNSSGTILMLGMAFLIQNLTKNLFWSLLYKNLCTIIK